ncbi:MAG TPA: hypothetical protein VN085_11540, partial [Vicinamibacterales bacterium]|nr:hypothetical protein [Vicinamibacterales bacterium]
IEVTEIVRAALAASRPAGVEGSSILDSSRGEEAGVLLSASASVRSEARPPLVPADALDKARELANWCRDGQPSRSQVRELAEFVLAALTPPSEPAVDWRAEAEFLMQMPLRYAIESYDDPPVRDRLLAQYQKVAYALVAQGGAAFGGDGAEA